ncbi:MAG: methyltransferase [Alphaproteobacteria bacterium]|nr:methyltransferase [Alphaproteobacteria bacterium]
MPDEPDNKASASAYTANPYPEYTFAETHPARIAAQGFLHGLTVPDPTTARVFEFGSASGNNLISHAVSLPDATFTGIDITPLQVERGRSEIEKRGLTNITLDCADILEVDLGNNEYDYIIAHGMLSWVPDDVKDRMLALTGKHLAANGIAYVSYNTLPGWSVNEAVADIMRLATDQESEKTSTIDRARAAHGLMTQLFQDATGPHVDLVNFELDHISKKHQTLVLHDELEGTNDPCYFLQFVEWAAEHGLKHFTDATLPTFWPTALLKKQRDILSGRGLSWLHMQQYLDFVDWRRFRRSLLCRADTTITELPDLERLEGIALQSHLRPAGRITVAPGVKVEYSMTKLDHNRPVVAVTDPLIQTFLQLLNADAKTFHSFAATRDTAAAKCNPTHADEAAQTRLRHWTMEAIALGWLDLAYLSNND